MLGYVNVPYTTAFAEFLKLAFLEHQRTVVGPFCVSLFKMLANMARGSVFVTWASVVVFLKLFAVLFLFFSSCNDSSYIWIITDMTNNKCNQYNLLLLPSLY